MGYYLDGVMTAAPIDTMFDTYAFLPSFDYHHDGALDDELAGCRTFTKQSLERYYDVQFDRQANMGALNEAAAQVKAALGIPNFRGELYLPIFTPVPTIAIFGEARGRLLDFREEADRLVAIEWQVEQQVLRMRDSGFEHIKLAGFYYVTEGLLPEQELVIPLLRHLNEYTRVRGYRTQWNTYNHWNTGYYRWKELGFKSCSQQTGYIPYMKGEEPYRSAQVKESMEEFAIRTELYGMGVTLEWSHLVGGTRGWKRFKEYLEGGVRYGYMLRPHTCYQLEDGPRSVAAVACGRPYSRKVNEDQAEKERRQMDVPAIRSLYRELFMFIKGTLTEDDIFWG